VARTRDAVLKAGRELLEAEGPDAVTHLRIGETTGIARTTIYRHWPDHDSLLAAVLSDAGTEGDDGPDTGELAGDLHLYLDQLRSGGGGGRRGRHGMAHGMAHVMARAEFDGNFADLRRERVEGRLAPLRTILRRGVERGELVEGLDVDEAAIDFVAPVFFRRFFLGERLSDERIDAMVDRFVARHGA
jgi:AcrR family transcriptional regulator